MGANDPQYTTTEPLSDTLNSAVASTLELTLLDRSGGGLLANPVIAGGFLGKERFLGGLGGKSVFVALGADKYATATEGNAFTVLDMASDAATVTPVRKGFARKVSDMARSLDHMGALAWARYTYDSTISFQQTAVSTMAALSTSFSATGGNSGGAATWSGIVSDMNTLGQANVAGPYVVVLRPKDWGNIAQDAFSSGGFVANSEETPRMLGAVNPGFKGVFMGGDLWVYTSQELPTSGGDTVSLMFGNQAIRWGAHMPAPSMATVPLLWTPLYGVEIARGNDGALKSDDTIVSSTHLGASIGINAAGIQLPYLT